MGLDHDLNPAESDHPPEMSEQIRRPVPCDERTISTSDRDAVEPGIGKRDRLNDDGLDPPALRRSAKQRGLERKDPIPVAACPLRKQYQSVACGKPLGYLVALGCRAADPPIDKDRPLQSRERSEKRPVR